MPFWVSCCVGTLLFGYASTRFKTIREPMFIGYLLFTAGEVAFATLQPGDDFSALAFAALGGLGFGAPLILVITGVQLSAPHRLIATATAVTTSARAVAATVFTAIYAAALNDNLAIKIPAYVAKAAAAAGLSPDVIPTFVKALSTKDTATLATIPGVTESVIAQGATALQHAFADSLRVIFMIAAPFGAVACILSLFLGDMRNTMNYHVDAPVEDLHAKQPHGGRTGQTA
jgi:hypothetical protein